MSAPAVVGILHPGQMGAAVAAQVAANGHTVLWCPNGRSEATAHRADHAGLHPAPLPELLDRSQLVVSICPPTAAEDVAADVAEIGYTGVYVDANAISPTRIQRIGARLTAAGATVVDGAISGPPPGNGGPPTRFYLAGPAADTRPIADLLATSHLEPIRLTGNPGQASALKMAVASYQKASRALAAVAHALADDHDVTGALLAEAQAMPSDILADRDFLPTVAARAWRWAPEMHEVADTLRAQHLPPDLALAAAAVLQCWNDNTPEPMHGPLTALRQLRDSTRRETDRTHRSSTKR